MFVKVICVISPVFSIAAIIAASAISGFASAGICLIEKTTEIVGGSKCRRVRVLVLCNTKIINSRKTLITQQKAVV